MDRRKGENEGEKERGCGRLGEIDRQRQRQKREGEKEREREGGGDLTAALSVLH